MGLLSALFDSKKDRDDDEELDELDKMIIMDEILDDDDDK